MGRRAVDMTNPVPALGARGVLSQKWEPLCNVGVQTSPELRSLPLLKKRNQMISKARGVSVPVETMSLDRAKPVLEECRNCINDVSQDKALQDGKEYCQIKSTQINSIQTGCRLKFKGNPRFANGSVVASELVEGVCSEGIETGEDGSQSHPKMLNQRQATSLKVEKMCPIVQCGSVNSYATHTRLCHTVTSSTLGMACGRKQSEVPCTTPSHSKRAASQIRASMTLPTPPRKNVPRLQKQQSTDTQTTLQTSIIHTCTEGVHNLATLSHKAVKKEKQTQSNEPATQPVLNKKDSPAAHVCKQIHKTQPRERPEPIKRHAPNSPQLTANCTTNQNHAATTFLMHPVCVVPEPPFPVLPTKTDCNVMPNLSAKKPSNLKSTELKTKPAESEALNASESEATIQTPPPDQELKFKMDPDIKPCPADHQSTQKNTTRPEISQCNDMPTALHGLLQNIEENLLSNQEKIKVLLNVIQDMEKSKAMSEGRCSYRTGQDINNCTTCQKTACIIYSVEHDFRLQEGRFQSVLEALDMDYGVPFIPKPHPSRPQTKSRIKKLRKKCFWWL